MGSTQEDLGLEKVRVLCLDPQAAGREILGLALAFETPEPTPSDTHFLQQATPPNPFQRFSPTADQTFKYMSLLCVCVGGHSHSNYHMAPGLIKLSDTTQTMLNLCE